jgi:hypothetical protein
MAAMASLFEQLDKMRPPVEEATPPPTEEAKAVSLFERLDKGRLPTPTEEVIKQLRGDSPIEKLLDWLVDHWAKDTVTAQEAYTYGPHSIRDKKTTLRLAQILVEQGWLVPIKTRRRDMWEWQIVRGVNSPAAASAAKRQLPNL